MTATLTVEAVEIDGEMVKRIVINCPHGMTESFSLQGATPIAEAEIVGVLITKHEAAEHCGCTRVLRRHAKPLLVNALHVTEVEP